MIASQFAALTLSNALTTKPVLRAIATLNGPQVYGTVKFIDNHRYSTIEVDLTGVPDGLHGFHIHRLGNLSKGCQSVCDHYNPFNVTHAGLVGGHVGDLGNVESINGRVKQTIRTEKIKLDGCYSVIGRSIVIHSGRDDLGLGGDVESLKTGNSGSRIGCAVIGWDD